MSPTYWTASQIKMAARANGWEFIKATDEVHFFFRYPSGVWGCRKPGRKVLFQEDRRGGLTQAWFVYAGRFDYFGPRRPQKLRAVLRFLEGLDHLSE